MITVTKDPHNGPMELMGLSTDTKPTTDVGGRPIRNGSTFIEMDTRHVYFFDASTSSWLGVGDDT